jgi:hypothetical protein
VAVELQASQGRERYSGLFLRSAVGLNVLDKWSESKANQGRPSLLNAAVHRRRVYSKTFQKVKAFWIARCSKKPPLLAVRVQPRCSVRLQRGAQIHHYVKCAAVLTPLVVRQSDYHKKVSVSVQATYMTQSVMSKRVSRVAVVLRRPNMIVTKAVSGVSSV